MMLTCKLNTKLNGAIFKATYLLNKSLSLKFLFVSTSFPGLLPIYKGKALVTRLSSCRSKGPFTRNDFVACDKLTTGLRHELFRVNQTYNSLTTVVYFTKNVVGFQNPTTIVGIGNVE